MYRPHLPDTGQTFHILDIVTQLANGNIIGHISEADLPEAKSVLRRVAAVYIQSQLDDQLH